MPGIGHIADLADLGRLQRGKDGVAPIGCGKHGVNVAHPCLLDHRADIPGARRGRQRDRLTSCAVQYRASRRVLRRKDHPMSQAHRPATLPVVTGTTLPVAVRRAVPGARSAKSLGDVAGLTQFGVNLLRLPPGAWSSQRHWHTRRGRIHLCSVGRGDAGHRRRRGGAARRRRAGFKAGDAERPLPAEPLRARGRTCWKSAAASPARAAYYSDIDMVAHAGRYAHRDGTPYPMSRAPRARLEPAQLLTTPARRRRGAGRRRLP